MPAPVGFAAESPFEFPEAFLAQEYKGAQSLTVAAAMEERASHYMLALETPTSSSARQRLGPGDHRHTLVIQWSSHRKKPDQGFYS